MPFACHIGLAEPDQTVATDPAGQRLRPCDDHGGQRRVGRPDHRAVGQRHPYRQRRRGSPQQPLGNGARDRGDRPNWWPGHIGPPVRIDGGVRLGLDAHSELPWRPTGTAVGSWGGLGITGTRRSHNVIPSIRMASAPASGASGAIS